MGLFDRVFRGSDEMFAKAEAEINAVVAELGESAPMKMPDTAYYLSCIYAYLGKKVTTLGELRDTLAENNIRLTWDDSLVDYLIEDSFSVKFGARNLRRAIEKQVEDELANRIIAAWEHPLSGAHVSAADGKILVQTI